MYGGQTRRFSGKVAAAVTGEGESDSGMAGIRGFRLEDIPELVSITDETTQAANWSKEGYEKLCALEGFLALVSESGGCISGFVAGRQVVDEGEIFNLAVRRQNRRRGEGHALVSALMKQLHRRGVNKVFLEVRESNEAGIAFYEKMGFTKTGRRPGYYREPEEAAVMMEKKLTG
jgi:ribosomal-protein-alanine N-acetyltransferase